MSECVCVFERERERKKNCCNNKLCKIMKVFVFCVACVQLKLTRGRGLPFSSLELRRARRSMKARMGLWPEVFSYTRKWALFTARKKKRFFSRCVLQVDGKKQCTSSGRFMRQKRENGHVSGSRQIDALVQKHWSACDECLVLQGWQCRRHIMHKQLGA